MPGIDSAPGPALARWYSAVRVWVLPPPNWVISVRTGAVFSRLARKAPQHHAGMLRQGASEASAREELLWVAVVPRRRPSHDLL